MNSASTRRGSAPAGFAIAPRPLVDVHTHEAVRALQIVLQAAGVAHGVAESLPAVVEPVLDARRQQPAEPQLELRREVPPNAIAAERQRSPRLLLPPRAEIHHAAQSYVLIGELPLMDH